MGEEHVIPQFMRKAQKIKNNYKSKQNSNLKFEIEGTGNETRAFCYIDDAIDGIIISSEKGT